MSSVLPTVAIKNGANDYRIINKSDFDESKGHVLYNGPLPRDTVTGLTVSNADGTYDEPTPTDIRYQDKNKTEFANNHGAHVGKSAAEMRAEAKLPDAPGGLEPDPVLAEAVEASKKAEESNAKKVAEDAKKAADKK